jgi:RNA polymerase sigma-70 factor (ECF subfamily)
MTDLTDIELLDRAQSGDAEAMECLFERHYTMVYRLAWRWCGVRDDAEDIAQETFVKLIRKLNTFRRRSSFKTWLYRIAVNTARDFGRRCGAQRSREEEYDEEGNHNPGSGLVDGTAAGRLREALDFLPAAQREAVLLVFSEGMSHREASQVLGCSEVTVSWRVFRARARLRTFLEQGI